MQPYKYVHFLLVRIFRSVLFHTIFVQCHKISSICVCDLIIEMKARLIEHLASFASNTNKLYILRHCINIALILLKNHIYPSTFIFRIK
jgi:hypothetical protein